jgi:DUF971 family protein
MATSRVWVSEDGKRLQLKCGDEEERRYHGVWLRHNCRCRECLGQESDQNIVHHSHLVDVTITNASIRNGDSVEVHWDGSTGSHSCTFSVDWLKKYDYTTDGVHENRRRSQEPVVTVSIHPSIHPFIHPLYRNISLKYRMMICHQVMLEYTSNE